MLDDLLAMIAGAAVTLASAFVVAVGGVVLIKLLG